MKKIITEINLLIQKNNYEKAYLVGLDAITKNPNDNEILNSLKDLSGKIRSECISLAYSRKDNTPEYLGLESLLKKVNTLTNEDMYGNPAKAT